MEETWSLVISKKSAKWLMTGEGSVLVEYWRLSKPWWGLYCFLRWATLSRKAWVMEVIFGLKLSRLGN